MASRKNKVNTEEKKHNLFLTDDELKVVVSMRVTKSSAEEVIDYIYENLECDEGDPAVDFMTELYKGKSLNEALDTFEDSISKYKSILGEVRGIVG